jgi:twitching motility protein PilT
MMVTSTIQDYLMSPEKTLLIKSAIQEGAKQYGMQTFDQSLMSLYTKGLITYDAAMQSSSNPSELALRMKGIHASSDTSWDAFEGAKEQAERADGDRQKDGPAGIVRY